MQAKDWHRKIADSVWGNAVWDAMKGAVRWLYPSLASLATGITTWLAGLDWRWIVPLTGLIFWGVGFVTVRKLRKGELKKPPSATIPDAGTAPSTSDDVLILATEEEGLEVGTVKHQNGILIEATQTFDQQRGHKCQVVVTNIQKLENGVPHTVAQLHKDDGAFRYGRIDLGLATRTATLHYREPQRWWLVADTRGRPRIDYTWGQNRTRGTIDVERGDWVATIEVLVSNKKVIRGIGFHLHGSGPTELLLKK